MVYKNVSSIINYFLPHCIINITIVLKNPTFKENIIFIDVIYLVLI